LSRSATYLALDCRSTLYAQRVAAAGDLHRVVAPGERDTDRVLAALRRHRRVVATVRAAATDARGQRTAITRRVRLR
jgi:hypothetical protein